MALNGVTNAISFVILETFKGASLSTTKKITTTFLPFCLVFAKNHVKI